MGLYKSSSTANHAKNVKKRTSVGFYFVWFVYFVVDFVVTSSPGIPTSLLSISAEP
jgi:hypothetical protein